MCERDDLPPVSASSSYWRNKAATARRGLLLALLAAAPPVAVRADEPGKSAPAAAAEPEPASAPDAMRSAATEPAAAPDCTAIPECVELVQSALRRSKTNQLNAALTTYKTAYAQYHSPWLLINIGRVQQKRGHPAEAIANYRTYLAMPQPSAVGTGLAQRYLAQAQQDLAAQQEKARFRVRDQPLYKKGWFWVLLGSGVVTVGAITVGGILSVSAGPRPDRMVPANTLNFSL